MPRTRVFLTWSGQRSKQVVMALRKWLPSVIQNLDPWMSEEDIDKGTQWSSEVSTRLHQSRIGIICLTPENLSEPWINFEAGALFKQEGSHVCTYLYDLSTQSIKYPLALFQATKAEKDDTRKLLQTINTFLKDDGLPPEQLNEAFEKWWPELENALSRIKPIPSGMPTPKRPNEEVLEDIVSTIRESSHAQSSILKELHQVRSVLEESRVVSRWPLQSGEGVVYQTDVGTPFIPGQRDMIFVQTAPSMLLKGYRPKVSETATKDVETGGKEKDE